MFKCECDGENVESFAIGISHELNIHTIFTKIRSYVYFTFMEKNSSKLENKEWLFIHTKIKSFDIIGLKKQIFKKWKPIFSNASQETLLVLSW